MTDFWIDSSALIAPRDGPYGFDIAPAFWQLLDERADNGDVASPIFVHNELLNVTDDLAEWAKERRDGPFFVEPDEEIQAAFSRVADYVQASCDQSHGKSFLDGADPWLIAYALVRGGVIVTFEVPAPGSKKVKIPDVAKQFDLTCVDTYEMVRRLGASWTPSS